MRKAYTLIELLLVVAIVAIIGSGVAVSYGRAFLTSSQRQLTLREMAEIKRAFLAFHNDNAATVSAGVSMPGSATRLPTDDFCATFRGSDVPTAWTESQPNVVYGLMEFYERFGLWGLLRPTLAWKDHQTKGDFIVFDQPDAQGVLGWHGPYLTTSAIVPCYLNADNFLVADSNRTVSASEPFFPQIATRADANGLDFYRVVYFEHCFDEGVSGEPVYRRLILVASRTPGALQTEDAVRALTGNRRLGEDDGYPLVRETGTVRLEDEDRGLYFLELLNLDRSRP